MNKIVKILNRKYLSKDSSSAWILLKVTKYESDSNYFSSKMQEQKSDLIALSFIFLKSSCYWNYYTLIPTYTYVNCIFLVLIKI